MNLKIYLSIMMLVLSSMIITTTTLSKESINTLDMDDGLIGYWSFENCNETGVYDDTLNDNHALFNGDGFSQDNRSDGLFGKCMIFDGIDDFLSIPNTVLTVEGGSISLWYKRTGESTGGNKAGGLFRNGNNRPLLYDHNPTSWHSGVFQVHWAQADNMSLGGGPKSYSNHFGASINNWYYVVFSWTSTHYSIYFNGQLVEDSDFDISPVTGSETWMGKYGIDNFFNGCIDEVRIYDIVLDSEDISSYYYSVRDNLLGYWSFENYDETEVFDDSQWNNPGVFNGDGFGPSKITDGVIGNALEFDGVDDYIMVENDYSYTSTSPLCMEAWIYPINLTYTLDGFHYYFGVKGFNSGIYHTSSGEIKAEFRNSSGIEFIYTIIENPQNKWYYIVWQWSDGKLEVYVDAEKKIDEPHADHKNYGHYFVLSTAPHAPGEYSKNCVKAKIDEVKIWDRALTEEEIETSYNQANSAQLDYMFKNIIYVGYVDLNLTNTGEATFSQIDYDISIQGGIFGLVNISVNGTINDLQPDQAITVSTEDSPVKMGLGFIDIKVKLTVYSNGGKPVIIEDVTQGLIIGKIMFVF